MTSSTARTAGLSELGRTASSQNTSSTRPSSSLNSSQWADTSSPWSRSKGIWDREPAVQTPSVMKDTRPASSLHGNGVTASSLTTNKPSVTDSWRRQYPGRASNVSPKDSAQSGTLIKPPTVSATQGLRAALPQATKLNYPPAPPRLWTGTPGSRPAQISYNNLSAPTSAIYPSARNTSDGGNNSVNTTGSNSWACDANGQQSVEVTDFYSIHNSWLSDTRGNPVDERPDQLKFKPFNEFLPSLPGNAYIHNKRQELSLGGWAESSSPRTPNSATQHQFPLNAANRSASAIDSDSMSSSLTNGFDSMSLNDASSRSSASRQSQESDSHLVHVSHADSRTFDPENLPNLQMSAWNKGSHTVHAPKTGNSPPNWRKEVSNNSSRGAADPGTLRKPMLESLDTRNKSAPYADKAWNFHSAHSDRDLARQEQFYPNGIDFCDSPSRQHQNSYVYSFPFDGSVNGMNIQVMIPAHNLQQMLPVNVYPPHDSMLEHDATQSIRSQVLIDYKTDKGGRRWELRDAFDHIVEFCGDQAGSKFIQVKLETANSEDKQRVFHEILPNACQLMCDVFGNYVMQRFFVHGDQIQKKVLAQHMQGKVQSLAKQMYGCRVLQKALKHILVEQSAALAKELDGKVLELVRDQNGNHVVQKVIKRVDWKEIPFVIDACVQNLHQLASHNYGCRVVQRLLRHYKGPLMGHILRELHAGSQALIVNQYGNYVTQHIIEYGSADDKARIIQTVKRNLVPYAREKYASNVVEKCILHGSDQDRRDIMVQLCAHTMEGGSPLTYLIKDNYGNYVIQKLLDLLRDDDYARFVRMLEPEINRIRRSLPNKQAENVYKKMHRQGHFLQQPSMMIQQQDTSRLQSREHHSRYTDAML